MFKMILLVICVSIFATTLVAGTNPGGLPACTGSLFCGGDLLHDVQMAKLFDDAKTFVDMRMKTDPQTVQDRFKALGANRTKSVTKAELKKFVNDNFYPVENDLETIIPEDWVQYPSQLDSIKNKTLKSWAFALNKLWKSLARNISRDARAHGERSSLIVVDNPFIIPGGRFREYYYWDSYWILNGVLACGMNNTAKGMIENYIKLVQRYGFVPNGGRVYYLNRSQPPFLIQMVELYMKYTNDEAFVLKYLDILEKEYQFWVNRRSVTVNISGKSYSQAIYRANMSTPRPESYWHDYEVGEMLNDTDEKSRFYQAVASAAESGWDFSSRWFNQTGPGNGTFKSIHTPDIIPVDLNCILYKNELSLASFFQLAKNEPQSKKYQELAKRRRLAINNVFWDERLGAWVDYDVTTQERTRDFYASSVVALWAGIARENSSREEHVYNMMKAKKMLDYPGGLPTSMKVSGQQWDFPNAWPPLQHMFIVGLSQSRSTLLQKKARKFAKSWIQSNWIGYNKNNYMFEKYVVTTQGSSGHGGEYKPQVGFGWSNGVILDLLLRYPDVLEDVNKASLPGLSLFALLFPLTLYLNC